MQTKKELYKGIKLATQFLIKKESLQLSRYKL